MVTDFFNSFVLAFIPLFIAIDVVGIVPIFIGYTRGWTPSAKNHLISRATLTALILCFIFLFSGQFLFRLMGITQNDFRIGGGIVLLVLAILDLFFSKPDQSRTLQDQAAGIVPIGVPLMVGPGALTTVLIVVENQGVLMASVSIIINLALVWVVFRQSHWIIKLMGVAGTQVVAKVTSLFMVAIAVMMIRVGIQEILKM